MRLRGRGGREAWREGEEAGTESREGRREEEGVEGAREGGRGEVIVDMVVCSSAVSTMEGPQDGEMLTDSSKLVVGGRFDL